MGFTFEEFPNSDYYDSDLREILNYMKEFESKLNGYDEVIAELKRELANISGLYDRVAALEQATSDLDKIRSDVRDVIAGLESLGNKERADIAYLQKQINDVKDTIADFERDVKDVYSYINYNVAKLDNKVDREVSRLMGVISDLEVSINNQLDYIRWRLDQIDTSVLNPWHTLEGRISQDRNVKHIYADLADGCLTGEEYARLGLTAKDYSWFGINAREYARRSREKLHLFWVYSPIHGWRQDINVVLTDIVNNFKGTYTASAYAGLGLTAREYADYEVTAYDYLSWRVPQQGVFVEDGVVQSQVYAFLIDDNGVVRVEGAESVMDENGVISFED